MNYLSFTQEEQETISESDRFQIIGVLDTVVFKKDAESYKVRIIEGPPAPDPSGWVEYTMRTLHHRTSVRHFYENWLKVPL